MYVGKCFRGQNDTQDRGPQKVGKDMKTKLSKVKKHTKPPSGQSIANAFCNLGYPRPEDDFLQDVVTVITRKRRMKFRPVQT